MVSSNEVMEANSSIKKANLFAVSLIAYVILVIFNVKQWPNVTGWGLGASQFLDLDTTMGFIECFEKHGISIYSINDGSNCSNYVYGLALVLFGKVLHLDLFPISVFGYLFLAILAFSIAYFLSLAKLGFKSAILISTLLIISPPFSLLAQRGNIDIFVILLVILGVTAFQRDRFFFAFLLIAITVLLKFYTLPLFLILVMQSGFKRFFYRATGALIVLLGVVNFLMIPTLPSNGTYAAFGNRAIYFYLTDAGLLSLDVPQIVGDLIGLLLLLTLITLFTVLKRKGSQNLEVNSSDFQLNVPSSFLIVSFSCYIFGMNYDYRLVFLILPLLVFRTEYKIVQYIAVILISITSFNSHYFIQLIGDVIIGTAMGYLIFLFLNQIFQSRGQLELSSRPTVPRS